MAPQLFVVPVPRENTVRELLARFLDKNRVSFGPIQHIEVPGEDTILICQCFNGENPYGLVIGLQKSDFSPHERTQAVMIEPIGREHWPEFAATLRGELEGPIIFHY